jgi:hypothetical protein
MVAFPGEVVSALTGFPEVGGHDPMFPFLTVDAAGYPHVCLLSRSELQADQTQIAAVVASAGTVQNLRRSGQATLVVVGSETAYYCKLDVVRWDEADHGLLGAVFTASSVKCDSMQLPLEPPMFLVTEAVRQEDDWASSRRVLQRLIG